MTRISPFQRVRDLKWPIRMYQDLRIAFHSLVKLLICLGSLLDANLMRNYEAWVCSPGYDHIAQVSIVFLHIALTRAYRKTL